MWHQERCGGKAQIGTHASQCCSCTWSTASESKKIWTQCFQSPGIRRTSTHTAMQWDLTFYPDRFTWYRYSLQSSSNRDMSPVRTSYSWCSSTLPLQIAYGLMLKPISTLMDSWSSRTQGAGPQKIHTYSRRHHSILQNGVHSASRGLLDQSLWRAP